MQDPAPQPPILDYNNPISTLLPPNSSSTPPLDQKSLIAFFKPKPRVAIWFLAGFLISLSTFLMGFWLEIFTPFPKFAYIRSTTQALNAMCYVMLFCQLMAFIRSAFFRRDLALAVLALILIPIYGFTWVMINGDSRSKDARLHRADTDIKTFEDAIDQFHVDVDRYPTQSEGLDILVFNPNDNALWYGPYLKNVPIDPWNTPYRYVIPGIHNPAGFDLASAGPDGVFDTSDDIAKWKPRIYTSD